MKIHFRIMKLLMKCTICRLYYSCIQFPFNKKQICSCMVMHEYMDLAQFHILCGRGVSLDRTLISLKTKLGHFIITFVIMLYYYFYCCVSIIQMTRLGNRLIIVTKNTSYNVRQYVNIL